MVIIFFAVILVVSTTASLLMLQRKESHKSIQRKLDIIAIGAGTASKATGIIPESEAPGLMQEINERVERHRLSSNLRTLIIHAGSTTTAGSVVITSICAAVVAVLIAHVVIGNFIVDALAFAVAASARWLLLKLKKGRRVKKFNAVLADAMELLSRALRAGHSINSAISVVAEQSAEPLGPEFGIVFQQQKFGIPFRDTILELNRRVPSKDLHFVTTAILVQKESGGDLTEVLDRATHVIRERLRIQGEIKTYTAQGRLTGWILASLPIVLLVILNVVSPGYSHVLFSDPWGHKLIYVGGTLIAVGGFIIRNIVDIKV